MLVIKRKEQESIIIDGCTEIVILGIRADKDSKNVSIGIVAPKSISVHRKEIQDAIIKERQSCGVGNKRILSGMVDS